MENQNKSPKMSSSPTENWDEADFITYLYLLMADADCEVTEDEKVAMDQNVNHIIGIFYPEKGYSYEASLAKVQHAVANQNLKAWDVIPSSLERFLFSPELKKHIIQDLTELMSADEEVTTPEYNTLLFIRRYFTDAL